MIAEEADKNHNFQSLFKNIKFPKNSLEYIFTFIQQHSPDIFSFDSNSLIRKQLRNELINIYNLLEGKKSRLKSIITKKLSQLIDASIIRAKELTIKSSFNLNSFIMLFIQKALGCYMRMDDIEELYACHFESTM